MKRKRWQSLLMLAIFIFSTVTNSISAYAEHSVQNDGFCAHHTAHTAECGYQEATDGSPCRHTCTEGSGCIIVDCVHKHDNTCGYIKGDKDSCKHSCTEESGCVKVNCVHTKHDDTCGYLAPAAAQPCQFLCSVCDCTCIAQCTDGKVNTDCPVCAKNWENCSFTEVDVKLSFDADYAACGKDNGGQLTLSASIDGKKITGVSVQITLTAEEAEMLSIPQDNEDITLENNQLFWTLTDDTGTGNVSVTSKIFAESDAPALLDIDKEDISVVLTPDEYQTSPLVAVSVAGDSLTFVEKMPTEDEYGSNMEYNTGVEDVTVHYVDREGKAVARQEKAPDFKLYYQVGDSTLVALEGDSLPFGLTEIPTITAQSDKNSWTGSVADTKNLPSAVLALDPDGNCVEKTVSWYLIPSYPDDYYPNAGYLVKITDENAAEYPFISGNGWYFIAGQEPFEDDTVMAEEYLEKLTHDVYWADNGNADGKRPQSLDGFYELQYALDGSSSYQILTEEKLDDLGITKMPQPELTHQSGIWKFSWEKSLPSKITYEDSTGSGASITRDVNWRVVFKENPQNYTMVEITPENAGKYSSVKDQYGTYYILETTLTFTARIYRGKTTQGDSLRQAFLEQFYLDAEYTGNQHQYFQLSSVKDDGHIINDAEENPDIISVTITNLWRYNLDNTRINYSIREGLDSSDGKLDGISTLEESDYFAISYDNSAVPSFSAVTNAVYSGGTLKLTLSGIMNYEATKVWLDNNTNTRPQILMELWRYRSGESYTTASLVRNDDGEPYTLDLSDVSANDDGSYPIVFDGLPKYDPEGYRYRYVVREYQYGDNADQYEQVFGKVFPDGSVEDVYPENDKRDPNDTYLYNGGTLSNRLHSTIPVSVTKEWKAASFQSEFDDVMVEMRLQSRYNNSEDSWEDTEYTCQLFGFLAENLTVTHTGTYPQFDELGKELEYRWVEESVYQGGVVTGDSYVGGTKVDSFINPDGTRMFTLNQNGRNIIYSSAADYIQEENHTYITNSITNTIDYHVIKEFEPEWNSEQYKDSYTFALFRTTSGSGYIHYATFTVNHDAETVQPTITKQEGIDEALLTIEQTEEWTVKISGLPEFDADGQQYEYLLLEQNGHPLQLETERDDDGNYTSTIYNGPGENNIILVRKEWIDESDSQHRLPVEITVFDKRTNSEIAKAILGTDTWYAMVGIGEYEYEDVYVLETKVGDTVVNYDTDNDGLPEPPIYTDDEHDDPTAVRFSTQYHDYEVTYAYDQDFGAEDGIFQGIHCFTVTNRRLGNINLTIAKDWVDGDGETRKTLKEALDRAGLQLAVRLEFMTKAPVDREKVYEISRTGYSDDTSGDTVTISSNNPTKIEDNNGNWMDSIQLLDLEQDDQILYFWNLPKYDSNGASVRYTVKEVFVNQQGQTVPQSSLTAENASTEYKAVAKAYQDYQLSAVPGKYIVGENHALDTQDFTLTNQLSATTSVNWYTLWLDDFAYVSGNRPDIYLNIYARTHVKDNNGTVTTQTNLCVRNYRWEYEADEGDTGISERNFWKCTIENLPKYDSLGYEIDYFAVMNSTVMTSDFDYLDTAYAPNRATDGENVFGNANGIWEEESAEHQGQIENVNTKPEQPIFALASGNTFVNTIYDTITYSGEKLWTNLPDNYPFVDLPTVTVTLDRSIDGEKVERGIATMTITGSDWDKLNESGHYVFEFTHTGDNIPDNNIEEIQIPDGEILLSRFDANGQLYTYTLREEIIWADTDAGVDIDAGEKIFDIGGTGQTLINSYCKGDAMLTAVKYLTVTKGGEKTVYPAITMRLSRTYMTNEGTVSPLEQIETIVWSADEVKEAVDKANDDDGDGKVTVSDSFVFDKLEIYAPNGSRYRYTITEDKSQLGGYLTWAAAGNLSAEELISEDTYQEKTSVGDLTAHNSGEIDASFLNQPQEPEKIQLSGTKVWNDFSNAFGFRPEDLSVGLTVKLERMANAQSGQNNKIDWHEVMIDQHDVKITWEVDPNNSNQWIYTVTGLERYAYTGMPWIYRITEIVPEHYSGTTITASQHTQDSDGSIKMNNLTNSILTSTGFKKTWVDENGKAITQNLLGNDIELEVSYALQLRAKPDDCADWSEWQNAGEYFDRTLATDDLSGLRQRTYTGAIRDVLGAASWSATHRGIGNSFLNLPLQIRAQDGTIQILQYRVVETAARVYRIGNNTPLLTQIYSAPTDNGSNRYTYMVSSDAGNLFLPYYSNGISQPNDTVEHKNQIMTTDLTVQKVWVGDNNEIYVTRPNSSVSRYDWEVTFVIERSTDGVEWNPIPANSQVTLYGTNADDMVSQTIEGLPVYIFNDEGVLEICQYRIRELQSTGLNAGQPLNNEDVFGCGYIVSYSEDGLTATNTLQKIEQRAVKDWNDDDENHPSITVELRYLKENGNPNNEEDYLSFEPAARVTLDGEADIDQTELYYAEDDWTAVWKELPLILAGSGLDANGHTIYRIFETASEKYLIETETSGNVTTITNTPTMTPSVTKHWLGINKAQSVTVELQRKIEGSQPQTVAQTELTETNHWTHVFDPQPLYDPDGNAYIYSVVETEIDGKKAETVAEEDGFLISYGGDIASGFQIYNHALDTVYVIKDWADAANPEGRPETLELTLQRTTASNPDENDWETVKGITYTWEKDGSNWTTSFADLPMYEIGTQQPYTYRVQETVPDGYVGTILSSDNLTFHFRNTLSDKINVPVRKVWVDNNDSFGYRPDSITVELYKNGVATGKTLTLAPSMFQNFWNQLTGATIGWSGVFEDLPKYDENGEIIVYTVVERDKQNHYEVSYDQDDDGTLIITNTAHGNLSVSKEVTGNINSEEVFNFTVQLDDDTITGQYGEMSFSQGKAIFTLSAGQSITASDLPAGINYIVSETEANQGAYTTISTGEKGKIISGDTAQVVFTNHRGSISVSVTKSWQDENNKDGIRPTSITIRLLADGIDTGRTLTLSESSDWKGSFDHLDEYQNGAKIIYTVEEMPVEGYNVKISGNTTEGFMITNSHIPDKQDPPIDSDETKPPTTNVSQTGDNINLWLWVLLGMIGLIGVLGTCFVIRKKK